MTSGTDAVVEDPKLVNRAAGDYHLPSDSPCINAGDSHLDGLPTADAEGRPRLLCGAVDIGAYELPGLPPPLTSIPSAKQARLHTWVHLTGQPVSAAFGGLFYIESAARTSGIRVENAPCTVGAGMQVDIEGVVHTNDNGECCIDAIAGTASPGAPVLPVGLSSGSLGGGAFGLQQAAWQMKKSRSSGLLEWHPDAGLNNIGLLVRVWGRVTQTFSTLNYHLDDGYARRDGSQSLVWDGRDYQIVDNLGVCITMSPAGLHPGQMLSVIGVVSCSGGPGNKLLPQILPVSVQVLRN